MAVYTEDTIAAVSTAPGQAGIGIVRVSGPCAVQVADRVFCAKNGKPLADAASHTVHYGHILTADAAGRAREAGGTAPGETAVDGGTAPGTVLDEVLVTVMRAPNTYTRQDVVEIGCHGGPLVLRQVLQELLSAGARLAEPGEFTRRAFLSGRIDLSQAEAVMDLIASSNKAAAASALSHLGGALRRRIEGLRAQILEETARIEAAMDDPEHYDISGELPQLEARLSEVKEALDGLIARAEEGRIVREGVNTVILGRPNVGKSTLLNLLAGEDRAIVTEEPGTTRDVLEEHVTLGGVPLNLADTAGLRETAGPVEKIGIERAHSAAEAADLILYVLDGSQILAEQDRTNLQAPAGKTVILIKNKADLRAQLSDEEARALLPGAPLVRMAAQDGRGLETLTGVIRERFFAGGLSAGDEVLVTSLRHREALQEASEATERVLSGIRAGMPEDLYTVDLMDAYAALARITGDEVGEDLIDEIFSRFCMGK